MTTNELNKFKIILSTKETELTRGLRRRDDIAIERTPDALDEVRLAAERELTTRSLELESNVLRDVRAALDRLADGSYGACLECEDEISQKRLHAMPWATFCIRCQEDADRNKGDRDAYRLKAA